MWSGAAQSTSSMADQMLSAEGEENSKSSRRCFGARPLFESFHVTAWEGDPIGLTVFEIAVKSADLTKQEQRQLLAETH